MQTVKQVARRLTHDHPRIHRVLKGSYQKSQYLKSWLRSKITKNQFGYSGPTRMVLPTERIVFANRLPDGRRSLPIDSHFQGIAAVKGGDWDLQRTDIESMPIFEAARNFLLNGVDMRHSSYYKGRAGTNDHVTEGAWREVFEENVDAEMSRMASLFRTIREDGYRDQHSLNSGKPFDEISVRIGRSGEILFENSIHRLIVAKLLGVSEIPVVVTVRHSDWARTRQLFYEYARSRSDGKVYGELPHPDLKDIPHRHAADPRLRLLSTHLKALPKGRALDIGADLGLFSHLLEDSGFNAAAVELDAQSVRFLRLLRKIENKNFEVISDDILEPGVQNRIHARKYSVVLGLNIFHHFLKSEASFSAFTRLLAGLNTDAMIFQSHAQNEKQMQDAYMNPSPEEFVRLLIDKSCLNTVSELGQTMGTRKVFLLTR